MRTVAGALAGAGSGVTTGDDVVTEAIFYSIAYSKKLTVVARQSAKTAARQPAFRVPEMR